MSYPNFNLEDETFSTQNDIHSNLIYTNEEVMNTIFGETYYPQPPNINTDFSNTAQESQTSRRPAKKIAKARTASQDEVIDTSRKQWTKAEDKRLAICYSSASQNSIVGNDQSAELFWNTIHSNYHTELPQGWVSTNTKKMFRQHWPPLAARCFKFATKMNACDHFVSGENDESKFAKVLELYKVDELKDFLDFEAYTLLAKDPRWFMDYEERLTGATPKRGNPTKKFRNETGSSSNSSFETQSSRVLEEEEIQMTDSSAPRGRGPRSIGRKQAKTKAKADESSGQLDSLAEQLREYSVSYEQKISVADRITQTLMAKEKRKKQKQDFQIMSMNPIDLNINEKLRQDILHMQAEVRARLGME